MREGKRVWRCDVCGRLDTWGPTWRWWAERPRGPGWRYADMECAAVLCSDACAAAYDQRRNEAGGHLRLRGSGAPPPEARRA